jgi:NADH:ubiquinone oxidoreductase subunit
MVRGEVSWFGSQYQRFGMARGGWKDFLIEIFAWWRGNTWGTRLWTRLHGKHVGTDAEGNSYFLGNDGRRVVIYNGPAEASRIPPGWHGWMHYRTDVIPTEDSYKPREWERPHQPNLTGTAGAYRPDGSILGKGERPRVTGDYDAWSPE